MGLYDGVDGTTVNIDLPFLNEYAGEYVVEIERLSDGVSKDGNGLLKAQVRVIESKGADAFPPDTRAMIMIKEDKRYPTYHKRDLVALAAAVHNVDPTKVTNKDLQAMGAEDNPCEGIKLRVQAIDSGKPIKSKPGKTRVNLKFAAVAN